MIFIILIIFLPNAESYSLCKSGFGALGEYKDIYCVYKYGIKQHKYMYNLSLPKVIHIAEQLEIKIS